MTHLPPDTDQPGQGMDLPPELNDDDEPRPGSPARTGETHDPPAKTLDPPTAGGAERQPAASVEPPSGPSAPSLDGNRPPIQPHEPLVRDATTRTTITLPLGSQVIIHPRSRTVGTETTASSGRNPLGRPGSPAGRNKGLEVRTGITIPPSLLPDDSLNAEESGEETLPASGRIPLAELPVEVVPVADVDLGPVRHDDDQLDALAGTMADLGVVHFPVLRRRGDRFVVVSGNGRVAAQLRVGAKTVRAILVPADPSYDLLVEYWQGVENCARVDPPAHERDALLVRNREIYERLHPESATATAKARAGRASAARRRATGEAASPVRSSTAATSDATGRSTRSVQLASARMKRAAPEVAAAYKRGELKPTQVDEIVKLPAGKQPKALAKVLGKSRDETRRVVHSALGPKPGRPPADPAQVVERLLRGLDDVEDRYQEAWNRRLDVATATGGAKARAIGKRLHTWASRLEKLAAAVEKGVR
ncbi:MAG: ParB N-terminal domain-containing protein [Deltaproteobacteria bacterium]|nr:ParB N-terminal domain-containing protein [Deltaproteobacteria bacterium]